MNLKEEREQAKTYRKTEQYSDAHDLYTALWIKTEDPSDRAGVLHCLRKLGRLGEARELADELVTRFPDHKWSRIEAIWTYVDVLGKASDKMPLAQTLDIATKIRGLDPDPLPLKLAVFTVLKQAKAQGMWRTVSDWVLLLTPDSLNDQPREFEGRPGWSEQAQWYNYRVKGLVECESYEEAIEQAIAAAAAFPNQRRFFLRLQAKALCLFGQATEGLFLYKDLCSGPRVEWWLLHEYAAFLAAEGNVDEALRKMCQAAQSNAKLSMMVTLLYDLGQLFKQAGDHETAQAHFSLVRGIREKEGWSIPPELGLAIAHEQLSYPDALRACRGAWAKQSALHHQKTSRKLTGQISQLRDERAYCFIKTTHGEDVYVSVSDLPQGIKEGAKVSFTAVPSFDKKKNREGWRAKRVTPLA